MPTQYPTLSQAEQTDRWKKMAGQNLYPYTYNFTGTFLFAEFPRNVGGFGYFTLAFQADNNLAISNLEVSFSGVPQIVASQAGSSTIQIGIQVSYDSTPNLSTVTPAITPIPPTDQGNIIYNNVTEVLIPAHAAASAATLYADPVTINDFHRYEPYNYLVKFNQIVYIHVGMVFNGAVPTGPDGTFFGSVIFHCLNTGLKT